MFTASADDEDIEKTEFDENILSAFENFYSESGDGTGELTYVIWN